MRRLAVMLLLANAAGCARGSNPAREPIASLRLVEVFDVEGRQGVAVDDERIYNSGSTALYAYDHAGQLLVANERPFEGLELAANHIGDVSVHAGELYAGLEWFEEGRGRDIQIAIYDARTLEYRRSITWEPESGQVEVSALGVDAGAGLVWMTDWVDGSAVYAYDLRSGSYRRKLTVEGAPPWQQGVAVFEGALYLTADDGDADEDAPDGLWRVQGREGPSSQAQLVHRFGDFRRAGEIEGLDFADGRLYVLSNRGRRIDRGTPKELYPGYERELHEVYVYELGD